jgi:hypothetical protein
VTVKHAAATSSIASKVVARRPRRAPSEANDVTMKSNVAMDSYATVVAKRLQRAPSKANDVTVKNVAATSSIASTVVARRPRRAASKAPLVTMMPNAAADSHVTVFAHLWRRECIEEPRRE